MTSERRVRGGASFYLRRHENNARVRRLRLKRFTRTCEGALKDYKRQKLTKIFPKLILTTVRYKNEVEIRLSERNVDVAKFKSKDKKNGKIS